MSKRNPSFFIYVRHLPPKIWKIDILWDDGREAKSYLTFHNLTELKDFLHKNKKSRKCLDVVTK